MGHQDVGIRLCHTIDTHRSRHRLTQTLPEVDTRVTRDALGSSPERSFLAPEIAYSDEFGQVGSET